ncbi:MAG: glycine betaine/L-proline ABC transporter substrate-binding protein ProX [Leptolyngbya sp. SIO1D8]|nr:glycine betaine/L-proline ABC transporter substrate-binding protein ProX [Leptolyngbya sp. SIO1D8]
MKFRGLTLISLIAAPLVDLMACQSTPNPSKNTSSERSLEEISTLPGEGITVRPAISTWLDEQFTIQIVNIGLEELGYETEEPQQADYTAINLAIANGDLDYTTAYYEPSHIDFFNNAGGDEMIARLGQLVPNGGLSGYLVDLKTATEYDLANVEQLKDSEIATLFDTDGDGKANLAGCPPGWSCTDRIEHHLDAYELRDTVEHDSGNHTAILADVVARYEAGEPILFFGYSPHWIFSILQPEEDVSWLEVPFTSLPGDQEEFIETDTTTDGLNLGHVPTRARILANKRFAQDNPVARRWFELVMIPAADINTESLRIRDGENTPEDIRRHAEEWVTQNREQVDQWLEEARKATN